MVKSLVIALVAAITSAIIYSKLPLISILWNNAPGRLPQINTLKNHEIVHVNTIRNCEDAVLADGFLIASCDPSRDTWNTIMGTLVNSSSTEQTGLYFLSTKSAKSTPEKIKLLDFRPEPSNFHPLGIEYHNGKIFLLNLAVSGPKIEIFKLLAKDRAATHIATLENPLVIAPNSIAAISDTELIVTNDHYFPASYSPILNLLETYTALPTGSVIYIKLDPKGTSITESKVLTRLPFANGVTLLNATTVAISALTKPSIELFDIKRLSSGSIDLISTKSIPVGFLVDNLSVDGNGKLLAAGHPFPPALDKIAANQRFCLDVEAASDPKCKFDRLSWVAEWSEAEGVKNLLVGTDYGTSTTALRDVKNGVGFVTGLYEKGLLRWTE